MDVLGGDGNGLPQRRRPPKENEAVGWLCASMKPLMVLLLGRDVKGAPVMLIEESGIGRRGGSHQLGLGDWHSVSVVKKARVRVMMLAMGLRSEGAIVMGIACIGAQGQYATGFGKRGCDLITILVD